ncbi:putative non-functional NADPH-dependent codeinone reductase 2-like [Capsicum annuum]|nr:putative non-functional NADPH-dependent codeinone reductase 2-like [Capsicum annuum]KAF3649167.1 putative non-functional NADPH-dependent codeinone reductase 2-like [Capsicum annuum]
MSLEFEMTDIGCMSYYLGLEVKQMEEGIFISQERYTKEILKKFNMFNCNPVDTSIESRAKLSSFIMVKNLTQFFSRVCGKSEENDHTDGNGDGKGHISVYLAIVGTSSSLADWVVNASFSFLIFDQIHDNYTVMRGANYSLMQEWSGVFTISRLNGVSRNVSLMQNSKLPLMVNLVNDRCIFGVDLYVVKKQGIGGANWYSAAACSWVWPAFLPRCEFSDPKKSFLIQDCCTVQADVYVVGVVKCLT